MNQNAIITQEQAAIEDVKRLANIVLGLRNDVFKDGLDYGKIPGTGDKPTLLQPGMEKLCRALHLRPEYVEKSKIEDFDKPLIYYRYECRLIDFETGLCISTAIGSANSHESKWRWRASERVCPNCGKPTIIKGKEDYGGGWLCFAKKGGCGAKFKDSDPAIMGQQVGRIENPDIFDQMNTIDKIAQKRALGSAIKCAANVSELFTVDLEDFAPYYTTNIVEGTFTVVEPEPDPKPGSAASTGTGQPNGDAFGKQFPPAGKWTPAMLYDATHDYFSAREHFDNHWDKHAADYAGKTLEEASAFVRDLHWCFDQDQCKRLVASAKAAYGMSIDDVMAALSDAAGKTVKRMSQWDAGNYATAQAALKAWADRQAEQDLAKEGVAGR